LALKPKCLLYFVDEMSQAQACVYVFFRPPYLLREDFDGVGVRLQMHEGGVVTTLLELAYGKLALACEKNASIRSGF
jgi:hypothetical protein